MTCRAKDCDYEATREIKGVRYCEICYLERTAADVRRVQRTLKADHFTRDMFGGDQ